MQHFLKFVGGVMDGASFEAPIAVDKIMLVGDNNSLHRYEVSSTKKSGNVHIYELNKSRHPKDYDEEIDDLKNRPRKKEKK